jgi:hypothetical protein
VIGNIQSVAIATDAVKGLGERTKGRVSEIGCPGARDICLTAADKYLPRQLSTGQLDYFRI